MTPGAQPTFPNLLAGGDRRSIGRADAVAAIVEKKPDRFAALWDCLSHADPLVRMRAADALEKVSRRHAELFKAKRKILLSDALDDGTPEMRWHLIAIASRLALSAREAKAFLRYLEDRVRNDPSRIVKATALEAAWRIGDASLLDFALASPWPALRARARKLLAFRDRAGKKPS